ncbi:MAG: DUF1302 domain-containing protein [Pseudomonas sp.]|uniref:DUF1302 domain-containing protein n=1 Tax=Pseudomonas sp. TaxID=306 RepID=UPI003D6F0A4B
MKKRCTEIVPVCASRKLGALYTATALALVAGNVSAVELDFGNPDIKSRFDNTVRYNLGVRTQGQNSAITNTPGFANSDLKFDRGDVVTNRLDVVSEFDFVFQDNVGFRVSSQTWYDDAYEDGKEVTNPNLPNSSAYPGNNYTSYVKRWNRGPSAEFLDAFVFKQFEIGDVSGGVKVGSHNLYWGESLFSFVHGVSNSQGPVDVRKAAANPGTEAKELFKPLTQVSATTNLTKTFSLSGQYLLDWKPSTLPDGGTYFGSSDFVTQGGGTVLPGGLPFTGINHRPDDRGDWGLAARWSPDWLQGTAGLYYRKYSDKLPQFALAPDFSSLGLDYLDKRVELIGASLSKNIGGIAFAAEVNHRKNTGLLGGGATTLGQEPIGDTWHGLVNAIAYVGKTPLFDSMPVQAEVTYSRLDKVRKNAANFNSVDYGCANVEADMGCATKDAWGLAIRVEPKWYRVIDGVDLSMPLFYSVGLKGNSPVVFGGNEGAGSYSAGVTADIYNTHLVTLAYNGIMADYQTSVNPITGQKFVSDVGGAAQWDRGYVSLTYKTSF